MRAPEGSRNALMLDIAPVYERSSPTILSQEEDEYMRWLQGGGTGLGRSGSDRDNLFLMYERMNNMLDVNAPGAERAFGPLHDQLQRYFQTRGRGGR